MAINGQKWTEVSFKATGWLDGQSWAQKAWCHIPRKQQQASCLGQPSPGLHQWYGGRSQWQLMQGCWCNYWSSQATRPPCLSGWICLAKASPCINLKTSLAYIYMYVDMYVCVHAIQPQQLWRTTTAQACNCTSTSRGIWDFKMNWSPKNRKN